MSDETPLAPVPGRGRTLAIIALAVGVLAVLLVGGAGPGSRMGLWHWSTGLRTVIKYGAYLGVLAVILSVVALLMARGRRAGRATLAVAGVALLLGLTAWYFPWSWRRHAQSVPPIHDITTDWVNPPELVQSRALRDTSTAEKMNTAVYEGDSIAAQQRQAYPDIRPVMLAMPLDEAFAAVVRTVRDMGWTEVEIHRDARTVEAVDETPWFGFKDDVVVRVTPASGISRVDIRSVSRVGRSDVGMNAERIRAFTERLRENYRNRIADPQ
ncbi:MAG TPA: DUF1499 domain-containing protein [Longimicrobium sp.]|nr:DUF1499 domain-containing protein [Longimicrobium sp.]